MSGGLIFFLTVLGISLAPIPQAGADPDLEVRLSQAKLELHQTTTLTLQIEWPKEEAAYVFALPTVPLQNLLVERQGESQETVRKDASERIRKTFVIELRPERPGEGTVGPFEIRYLDPSSQEGGTFSVGEQKITIRRPSPDLPLQGIALLGIPAALAATWVIARRRKKRSLPEPTSQPSQAERTLSKLKTIREQRGNKTQRDLIQEWSSELRHFVSDFYDLPSESRLTEQQILECLKTKEISRQEIEALARLLDRLREAKFMGVALGESDFERLQKDIYQFIQGKRVIAHPEGGS